MSLFKNIPHPLTILIGVIILSAAATWLVPAGKFDTLTYDGSTSFVWNHRGQELSLPFTQHTLDRLNIRVSLKSFSDGEIRKPLSVPGTYYRLPQKSAGWTEIIEAPLKGIYDTIDIVLFLLVIGGFINIFYSTGAMEKGLLSLSYTMKGKEGWLIIILTFLFSFAGASYGMAEEGMAFYPIMVPLFIAAGYDLLVPVAVIFGGTQLGTLSSFSNPFSTIIASNAAGVNWSNGFSGRMLLFVLSTLLFIWYLGRYAAKIRKDPQASLVRQCDGEVASPYINVEKAPSGETHIGPRNAGLLLLFLATFLLMIGGVVFLHWWLLEMTAVFLVSSILVAVFVRMSERTFIEKFIEGAETLLGVTFIIGAARGVSIVLEDGNISDTIIFYSASLISHMPPALFIVVLFALYMIFTLFISSSSGMAVVTMPIIGSLAFVAGVPGREIVNSYLFGMGVMGFITPTGLILPSLALVNVSMKAWWKFIWPYMLLLFIICAIFLITGIYLK